MRNQTMRRASWEALRFFLMTLLVFGCFNIVAFAQEDTEEASDEPVEEYMTVTGTRIKRTDAEGPAPIDVVDLDQIQKLGTVSIDRILQQLPAVTGGALNTNITNGNDDRSTVTLRGLPSDNCLVLLDGRRLVNHGRASASVDLNSIPMQIIERIEVYKDGASAVYGSDAVAGVVNIITRDFDGLEVPVYYGQTSRSDLETQDYSFLYGKKFDKGSLLLSANYYDRGIIWSRDRAISDDADTSDFGIEGGYINRSSATVDGFFNTSQGVMTYDASANHPDFGPYRAFDNTIDRYNFREETPAVFPQERANIYFKGHTEIMDGIDAFMEAHYMNIKSQNDLAPNPLFTIQTGYNAAPVITVSADNIYNPFGEDLIDIRRRLIEFGRRTASREGDNFRFVGGLRGTFFDSWDWDATFLWHEDKRSNYQNGALIGPRTVLALGPNDVCEADPDCVPLDLFHGGGSITQDQVDYLNTAGLFTGRSQIRSISLNTNGFLGYLPAGPAGLAAGIEYREESGEDNPDSLVSQGQTIGFTNFERTFGKRDATEAYVELNLPLFNDMPAAKVLELSLAGRYSDYSDFGTNFAPMGGLRYKPVEQLLVRATYSESFKAATMNQLYSGDSQSFPQLSDPLAPADDTRTQFLTIYGSNPNLEPEESENFTVGIVVEPTRNFSFTADMFSIDQTNVVRANPQYILDRNAQDGSYADRIIRDQNGYLQRVDASFINVGQREVSGFDFSFNYRIPETSVGDFNLTLNGTYMDSFKEQDTPDSPKIEWADRFDGNGGPGSCPDLRSNFIGTLTRDNMDFTLAANYISSYWETEYVNGYDREIDSWLTFDVQFSIALDSKFGTNLSLGIDNITDEEPPFSSQAFNDNFDGSMHNLFGMFWYLRINNRF